MAAPTTIHDLPDDMLHEIFGHVLAGEPKQDDTFVLFTHLPPEGAHLALRCVCRRWRDIADWVRLSTSTIVVDTSELAADGTVRARHPAAFKDLALGSSTDAHSLSVSRAAYSLINSSADMRRSLLLCELHTCCLQSLLPAVTPVASCTALSLLKLFWGGHSRARVVPSNVLAPLSALRMLAKLVYGHLPNIVMAPTPALLAPLPALPDAPSLTALSLNMAGNFVPVGSDAALGRLRKLVFEPKLPVQELLDAEDPFLLRTAFDAGTWKPSRLTGLRQLSVKFGPVSDSRAPSRPSRTGSRSGSEWAPLAGQVTSLIVEVQSTGYTRPSTGIVAGLGVLTALRDLRVDVNWQTPTRNDQPLPGPLEPLSLDREYAPQLTHLMSACVSTPASVDRFPKLVFLSLVSVSHQPPLHLRSLIARSSLKILILGSKYSSASYCINLAELFVGGSGWPVLEKLILGSMVLEWDATGLAGAPTAAEFAERARQLLPALVKVLIEEPSGRGALPDRSRVGFVVACRRHVVPVLLGMHEGGVWV